jgi:adenylate kinase
MEHATKTIVLMGLPGSGKGTQGNILADRVNGIRFSTGDRFRELRAGEGALSKRVSEAYDSGKLFPDWFATYLFEDAVLNLPAEGSIVFDGYPRTRAQAEIFNETMEWLGRPYSVVNLVVDEEEALRLGEEADELTALLDREPIA